VQAVRSAFLDDCDERGVWPPAQRDSRGALVEPVSCGRRIRWRKNLSGDERWTDITFRLGLIGRLRRAHHRAGVTRLFARR